MTTNDNSNNTLAVAIHQALAEPGGTTPPPAVAPVGKARIQLTAFTTATDAELMVFSQHVITGMTGNAAYPAPTPTLADLTAALNAFKVAASAAMDSRRQIVIRKQRRAVLIGMLRNLALYVQLACGGDLPTLMSSGYTAQRTRQPVGPLPAPANLRLKRGPNSGQITARCNRTPQAGAYEWRYAYAATPTAWVEVDSTFAASVVIEGLVPTTQYIVQVRALGTNGPSDWSDSAGVIVV
jgi:hypothetical protein